MGKKWGGWIRQNAGTLLLFLIVLGFLAYQKIPLYLKDRDYVDRPAPDFVLESMDGRTIRLSDLRGKKVLLNFWATWCVPCRVEIPGLNRMATELEGDNFRFLAIASEDPETIRRFMKEHTMNYTVLVDSGLEAVSLYDVRVYPGFVYIDEDGMIRDISHGMNLFMPWIMRWRVHGRLW